MLRAWGLPDPWGIGFFVRRQPRVNPVVELDPWAQAIAADSRPCLSRSPHSNPGV